MSVFRALFALFLVVILAAPARSDEDKPALAISREDGIQYGFPSRLGNQGCRVGAWMPVYVKLVCGDDPISLGQYDLVVQTNDSDDIQNQYTIPVPALGPNEERVVITYTRPGTHDARIQVMLREGRRELPTPKAPLLSGLLDPTDIFYLTLGPRLAELDRALTPPPNQQDDPRNRVRFSHVDDLSQMPDRWFGYGAVDTIFLGTGTRFIEDLRDNLQTGGRSSGAALAEWVRRGGKLVIAVGRNHQAAGEVLSRLGLIDCKLAGQSTMKSVTPLSTWADWRGESIAELSVTALEPGPGVTTLVAAAPSGAKGKPRPLVVTAPCGLGRVILLAFDVDGPPLTSWGGRNDFWKRVHQEVKPRVAAADSRATYQVGTPELGKSLQQSLETFEEVPVISFGWVALFIFVYILIVGPLDYFFLKKVVKRLELTWVTFPLVVVVISVAAYFIAYKVKGNDLRINKTDVIDYDLTQGKDGDQVHGTTWCTLFSPRIQNYTIGVEPSPDWAPEQPNPLIDYGPVVTTLSPPDSGPGGMNRSSSQSLFSRPYVYADGAAGLQGVPIPVWASRSFAATWQTPLGRQTPLKHELRPNVNGDYLMGTLTSTLPVTLTEVALHYQGAWYQLNASRTLAPGDHINVAPLNMKARPASGLGGGWLTTEFQSFRRAPEANKKPTGWGEPTSGYRGEALMKSILFYSADNIQHASMNNSNLRSLDQGWRLRRMTSVTGSERSDRYLNEVILVGRVTAPSSTAEQVHTSPASPTRLWLGRLPGDKAGRPSLDGKLSQDTYVRIYIPIAEAK